MLEKVQTQHSASPSNIEDYITNINYNEKAQRTKIEYGNGTQTTYKYNNKNFRLTNLKTVRGSDILQNISYIYDPEGNITETEDLAQQTIYFNGSVIEPKSLYEYDALYRLKKATGREHNSLANLTNNDFVNNIIRPEDGQNMRNFTQEYKYDQIGNLLQMKSNGVWTRDYMYNFATNNHLLKHDENATINSYEYDAHGNTTKMPHLQELKYDYADQLNEVTLNLDGNKAYYIYNAEGERVRKVVEKGNIKEERFYIGDYELYTKKTNETLDTERETLHIVDDKSKVALIDNDGTNTTIRYQYTNHLDSASLELDETGAIITYEEYHPFGTTSYRSGRNETEVKQKRYKYVHKELDNETGLYYYGMRYYAPWIARFISVDPLQFKFPYLTPFQYASNDPIGAIDLDGAESTKELEKQGQSISLAFGPKLTPKAISENPANENWKGYELETLSNTLNVINSIKNSGSTINTVYLNSHGYLSGGGAALLHGKNGSIEAEGAVARPNGGFRHIDPVTDDGYIDKFQLDWYSGLSKSDYDYSKKSGNEILVGIEQLISIANEIEDGGTLILGGCDIGKGKNGIEFMSKLYEITGKRINIVANTTTSISTDHYNKKIKERHIKTKRVNGKIYKTEIPTQRVQFDLLLDKGLTSSKGQNNGVGWRKLGPKTNGVISTKKDLYLNTKGDAYSFKPFTAFSIPDYYRK